MECRVRLVGCYVMVALAIGCSSEPESKALPNGSSGAECPEEAMPTYESFAAPFFASYCTRCHATGNVGSARRGAPEGYNWDDRASIQAHAVQIDAAAAAGPRASNDMMPPGDPLPTAAERARLGQWLACEFGN